MDFFNTSIQNDKFNIIFTGSHYYFYNDFYGLTCILKREYTKENAKFTLYYGNESAPCNYFNTTFLNSVKRFIIKKENEIIKQNVDFNLVTTDLHATHFDIIVTDLNDNKIF